jgi:hypothetical protein
MGNMSPDAQCLFDYAEWFAGGASLHETGLRQAV